MKFEEMKYERPDYEETAGKMNELVDLLENAKSSAEFLKVFSTLNKIRIHIQTMKILCEIRHSINTKDEFYDKENDYWDETSPKYDNIDTRMMKACLNAPFKDELLKEIPETFFQLAECKLKSFDEKIIPALVLENKLNSEYGKLKASAKIEFEGKTYNLSTISTFLEVSDRNKRKAAFDAKMKFYEEHEEEFDCIYDDMVKVRTEMAKQLGFNNYVELAYYRMNRLDYDCQMVSEYRNQILKYCTPLACEIVEKQRKRLGLDQITYYDFDLHFQSGNPKPRGNRDELVKSAVKMYHEMSQETGDFIDLMNENDLWDLDSRENKEMGGYETEIPEYHVPFIFSNFNGTSGDVDVLTHEAGHAFQTYMANDITIPEVCCPTMESAEIDSMSMEFFAYPWMEEFFKEDSEKYKYDHLSHTITFLPYGVLVDHFQEEVYLHPDWTPAQRKACWRELEKMYVPFKNYDGCELLEKGCWWYQQSHIFQGPFYYIDYTLAQVCAQEFFIRKEENDSEYWNDYLHLLKLGGTKSFTKLCEEAHIGVPFTEGTVKDVMLKLKQKLDAVDDTQWN